MSSVEKLFEYGKTILTETELQQVIKETDYGLFHHVVETLVDDGILVPVKSSGLNGRLPPLFNKYRIIKPKEDFSGYFESIRHLNPALNISGYLKRPELYKKHREIVEGLSRYLWYSAELLEEPMSRKERSFSVWGGEKLLDNHFALVREVLRYNGLGEEFLNYYDTPEPFFEYVHARPEQMTVLILENKDTWFTFRKLMQDTGKNIVAGTPVDVLLYGEGNKISKCGALEEYNAVMLGGKRGQAGRFLYFGDLDREGIRLFFRARGANPNLDIKPFSALYQLMLKLAEGMELPESPDERRVEAPLSDFTSMLGFDRVDVLTVFLEKGRYIPQEIVNYQVVSSILS
ncbi:MAG: DUF2220 domain-containing protein [Firmicutes bacterium]|nr:DUF2220 domain-containing protein [Bacillota bacterium]MCL5780457.1 DUF2220 domain-containing protein [Bacillota bacterium]